MMHDRLDGCYRIGWPGSLIPLPDRMGALESTRDVAAKVSQSATGTRRVLLPQQRAARTWSVSIPRCRPDEIAPLLELEAITSWMPPLCWVSPWAAVTNVLTPPLASLDWLAGIRGRLGRTPLAEGGHTLGAVTSLTTTQTWRVVAGALLCDTRPWTATLRVAGTGTVTLTADEIDSAGTTVRSTTAKITATQAELRPVSVSQPAVHSRAVRLHMQVSGATAVARPQVTWTPGPVEYGVGEGAVSVVLAGEIKTDVVMAVPDADKGAYRLLDAAFSLIEYGPTGGNR